MDPEKTADQQAAAGVPVCRNCRMQDSVPGYATELCSDCRNQFLKLRIPKWIYLFGAGILIVMAIGMFRMPKYFSATLHLARGERAIHEKRYFTAQRELQQAAAIDGDNVHLNCRLFIAACYNKDLTVAAGMFEKIRYKQSDDRNLEDELTEAGDYLGVALQSDSTTAAELAALPENSGAYLRYFNSIDSSDTLRIMTAGIFIANQLFDLKDYTAADTINKKLLYLQPDNFLVQHLAVALNRELHHFDEAIAFCDKMISINHEDIYAIGAKARVELKRKNDQQAAVYASQAMRINPHDPSAMEAQAMVDYYAGRTSESSRMLADIRKEELTTGDSTISVRLGNILNGTVSFR